MKIKKKNVSFLHFLIWLYWTHDYSLVRSAFQTLFPQQKIGIRNFPFVHWSTLEIHPPIAKFQNIIL